MESSIMRNASRFLREQKKKRKWQKVLACLALVVAAGTTIALIMPGQALDSTEKVLDCQIEVHQHTADCYAEDGTTLICGLADYVAHTHNELCYNEEGELICKLPEMPAHQHTADCYAEERVLTCGLEETPEDGEGIPVSGGDQENAAPHVHTDECYTTVSHLICGQLEAVEHVHTDACFKEVMVDGEKEATDETLTDTEVTDVSPGDLAALEDEWYFCGKSAHTHSDECYDLAGNVICGYEEHVHTEECLEEKIQICELEEHTHDASCYDENGNIVCGLAEHEHKAKCFVIYWCGLPAHIHNAACYAGLDVTSGDVEGTLRCGLEEHEHTEECLIAPILERVFEDRESGIRVTATYPASAMIPEEAEFRVVRITNDNSPQYFAERYSDVQDTLNIVNPDVIALLNIGFFMEDGTELTPEDSVTISLQFLNEEGLTVGDPVTMIHFAESGTEVLDSTNIDTDGTTTFVTDEFSDFAAISGTVQMPNSNKDKVDSNRYFEHNKYIDYLGDDGNNTDTDLRGDDKYRLYLDMEGIIKPIDLLIIVDRSSSMSTNNRDQQLINLLNGTAEKSGLIKDFLAPNVGKTSEKDKNHIAIVWYAGHYETITGKSERDMEVTRDPRSEGDVALSWTSNVTTVVDSDKLKWGAFTGYNVHQSGVSTTNYVAGLVQADQMLKIAEENPDTKDHQKVVIFISDGLPTQFYYYDDFLAAWNGTTAYSALHRYGGGSDLMVYSDAQKISGNTKGMTSSDNQPGMVYNYARKKDSSVTGVLMKTADGKEAYGIQPDDNLTTDDILSGSTVNQLKKAENSPYINETNKIFDLFYDRYPNVSFYAVGIDMDTPQNGFDRTPVLDYMMKKYTGKEKAAIRINATTQGELEKKLRQIVFPANVAITDKLSAYVDLWLKNIDVLVTATSKNDSSNVITLWKGDEAELNNGIYTLGKSKDNKINGFEGVVKTVTYNTATREITVEFDDEYALGAEYRYQLSFNVEVTENAFDRYANFGYDDTGEKNSDLGKTNNNTSSNKSGFFSNDEAKVTYEIDGKEYELPYQKPVVQTWKSVLTLKKEDEDTAKLEGIAFQLELKHEDGTKEYVRPNSSMTKSEDGYYLTDENGIITYQILEHGDYTLREKVANDQGFIVGTNDKVITFKVEKGRIKETSDYKDPKSDYRYKWELDTNGNELNSTYNYTLTVTNDLQEIPVEFKKTDEAGNPVPDAEFQLFKDVTETTEDILIANGVSTKDGVILWYCVKDGEAAIEPVQQLQLRMGKYFLVETKSPSGYVDPGTKAIVTFEVVPKADGTLDVKKVEVEADDNGYGNLWDFTSSKPDGNKTVFEITVQNIAMGIQLQVLKQGFGVDSKNVFAGAEFYLYQTKDGSDPVIAKGVTDKDGHIVWTEETIQEPAAPHETNLTILYLPEGSYYLLETKAPKGFQKFDEKIPINVYLDLTTNKLKVADFKDEGDYGLTFNSNEALLVVNVHNTPADVEIQIIKTGDSYSDAPESSINLPGAVFELYQMNKNGPVRVGDYISDDRGLLVVDKNANHLLDKDEEYAESKIPLKFGGQYCLKEIQGPYGYNKFTGDIYFKVIADEETGYAKVVLTDSSGGPANYGGDIILSPNNDISVSEPITPFTLTVKNHMGAELPETGGNGIYRYMLSGLMLVFAAMIALMYRNKKKLY